MHRMHKRISNIIGLGNLPRAVVKVRVPRRPGAVEGERQLLVVLVLLTPHPEGGEHLSATGTSSSATMLHAQPNRAPRCKAVQAKRGRGMTKMCHGTRERASLRALGTPPATRAVCPPFT